MASLFNLTVLLVLVGVYHVTAYSVAKRSHGWSYEGETGPEFWPEIDPTCGGQSQSPINIDLETATPYVFDPFNLRWTGGSFKMTNNGHSVQIDVTGGKYEVSGGGLPGAQYRLLQFHWHWGSANYKGSEHTVDGFQYSAENHFVLYDTQYGDFDTAKTQPDGIAVIAVLVKVGEHNHAYDPVAHALSQVINPGDVQPMSGVLNPLGILPGDLSEFARYRGSLTTPSCLETVLWTVMLEPVEISQSQLNAFHQVLDHDGHHLADNFRPTQPLNGRTVYHQSD